MQLTIFAATGGVGRLLLQQAIDGGHEAVAVARDLTKLPPNLPKKLRMISADLSAPDQVALKSAVEGSTTALSGLGPPSKSEVGIAWRGTQAIVEAMKAAGVRRLIVVSAAPIGTVPSPARPNPPRYDPGDGFIMRHVLSPLTKAILREHYADLAHMEDIVQSSGLDWTIVRPPRLTDKPLSGKYRFALGHNLRRGLYVSRANVAHCMLRVIGQPETIRQVVGVAD